MIDNKTKLKRLRRQSHFMMDRPSVTVRSNVLYFSTSAVSKLSIEKYSNCFLSVEDGIETNMVFFNVEGTGLTAEAFRDRLIAEHGIRIGANNVYRMRAVTHLDISREGIERAAAAVRDLARSVRS